MKPCSSRGPSWVSHFPRAGVGSRAPTSPGRLVRTAQRSPDPQRPALSTAAGAPGCALASVLPSWRPTRTRPEEAPGVEPGSVTGLQVSHATHCAPEDSGTSGSPAPPGTPCGVDARARGLSVMGWPRGGQGRPSGEGALSCAATGMGVQGPEGASLKGNKWGGRPSHKCCRRLELGEGEAEGWQGRLAQGP